jgi:hypothetical protein
MLDFILIHGFNLNPEGKIQPILRQRLEDGLQLYAEGAAEQLIVAGRNGPEDRAWVDRNGITQADLMAQYLKDHGIPTAAIALERDGTTTWECTNNAFTSIVPPHARGGYIVSNQEHLPRITLQTQKILHLLHQKDPTFPFDMDIRYAGSPILDPHERAVFLAHERDALRYTLSRDD